MTELAFTVTDRKVTRTDTARIVGGSIDEYTAEFTLDAMWTESIITSVWAKGDDAYKAVLTAGVCNVPNEVLIGYGEVTVSLYAGNLRTVVPACLWVEKSGYIEGVTPATPTPSEYAQIVEAYDSKADKADTYTESEVDALLDDKSDADHTHDDRYYTDDEIDTKLGDILSIGAITEDITPIESLSSGVYTLDGTGGTLLIGSSGETFDYGTVIISNDLDSGFINWIAVGRDYGYYFGVFLGQSVKTGEWWEPTYQAIPDFGELSETIGDKQSKPLVFTDVTVSEWAADTTYDGYGYKATIPLTGATATMIPHVYFDGDDAISGNYAPPPESFAGGIYIYGKVDDEITVPLIVLEATS